MYFKIVNHLLELLIPGSVNWSFESVFYVCSSLSEFIIAPNLKIINERILVTYHKHKQQF